MHIGDWALSIDFFCENCPEVQERFALIRKPYNQRIAFFLSKILGHSFLIFRRIVMNDENDCGQ